jgi:tetratricopeptide (TPR) repeat protein
MFALLFAGVLIVLLFFARIKPDNKEIVIGNDLATEIENAVTMIKEGGQPMQGILKLKEIADQNPDNEDAQLYLGLFSIQSGQYDKAVNRFDNVIKLNPENGYAYQLLGQSYELMSDTLKAIQNYELFIDKTDDEDAKEDIEKHLRNLKI